MRINRDDIDHELTAAEASRAAGNEGKARVQARRAAGWSVGLAFAEALGTATPNAYVLLRWLSQQSGVPENLRLAATRLTTRITEDHDLPHSQDPLADARLIVQRLLDERGGDNG